MSSYFFITKTFFLYCFIKDASSWILRFKKIWRPKKPGENLENLCVFVQGYTWAIGAVGQFGAGSLKNLITSSQPWQGCRWGLLRVPPQKKAAELFWCVFFFFRLFFFWSLWILFWIKMYHHLSSCIILSSLFVIFFGTCGINYRKLVKKTVTENDGTWGKKNEVHQLIDRLDLSLIQLGPVESSLQWCLQHVSCVRIWMQSESQYLRRWSGARILNWDPKNWVFFANSLQQSVGLMRDRRDGRMELGDFLKISMFRSVFLFLLRCGKRGTGGTGWYFHILPSSSANSLPPETNSAAGNALMMPQVRGMSTRWSESCTSYHIVPS